MYPRSSYQGSEVAFSLEAENNSMWSHFGKAADVRKFHVREKDTAMKTNMNDSEASVYDWTENYNLTDFHSSLNLLILWQH
jgi:hypothetical protein